MLGDGSNRFRDFPRLANLPILRNLDRFRLTHLSDREKIRIEIRVLIFEKFPVG